MAYAVELTEYAESFLLDNVTSERVLERIERSVEMLAEYPEAGPSYNPFTLYYLTDDEAQLVTVFDIEWTAGDPRARFTFV